MTRRSLFPIALLPLQSALSADPVHLAIAGLVHGHVDGFFRSLRARPDVKIVAIWEPVPALHKKYAAKYSFPPELFFTDLSKMLDTAHPQAVAAFTNTFDHPAVVAACAPRHIHVMMEKPLAISLAHARDIQHAAAKGNIQIMVNYETTWYASHAALYDTIKRARQGGEIRRIVAMDGHEGPKEIGVGPEFLSWLSDPAKNGAGALFDFGCYGANLMTWLLDNQRPLSVTAVTRRFKPAIYPRVDDDATILLEYPNAQGVIEASWNWPFGRKDLEVYAERAYAIANGGNVLKLRLPGKPEQSTVPERLPAHKRDPVSYLKAIVQGRHKPTGLSSLDNNMIVTGILEAARDSAKSGKTVHLARH